MKRWLIVMFGCVLVLTVAAVATGPSVGAQETSTWEEAIVQVRMRNPTAIELVMGGVSVPPKLGAASIGGGTAFHVGGGVFYTNGHVAKFPEGWPKEAEGYAQHTIVSPERARQEGQRFWWPLTRTCLHRRWVDDKQYANPFDVAQFKVSDWDAQNFPALRLSSKAAAQGDRVRMLGFPSASREWPPKRYLATGVVQEVSVFEEVFLIRVETGFSWGGSSGSPVLDEANEVVGIVYGGNWAGQEPKAIAATVAAIQTACR